MSGFRFRDWENLHILIIGDLMMDRYIYGNVERISPEAPVPILNLTQRNDRLGGASNVALNIKALGAIPHLLGVVGSDPDAVKFLELIMKEGMDTSGIFQEPDRPTTVKTRVLSSSQQMLRIDEESTKDIPSEIQSQLLASIQKQIRNQTPDAIIFQDYNKGVLVPQLIKEIIRLGKKHRIPTIVDPKINNFYAYQGVDLFKPNLKETRAQVPFPVSPTLPDLTKASNYLAEKLHHRISMITLSEHGIFLSDEHNSEIYPVSKKDIIDVCGAGDTVLSIAALGMASELPLETIGTLANMAGGQVCGNLGVVPVNREALEQEYLEHIIKIGS